MVEKPKGFLKKIENFWYHYKIVFLIALFFVCSFTFLMVDYLKKKDPDMVLCYISQTYGSEAQFGSVEEELKEIVGDLTGDGRAQLNYRLIFVRAQSSNDADVTTKQGFNYSFLDKNVRLYIIEDRFFEEKTLFFEPLEGVLSEEQLSGGLKNPDGQICVVPLTDSPVAEKMDLNRPELYVGIKRIMDTERNDELAHRQHEKAKEVLKYILEGEI